MSEIPVAPLDSVSPFLAAVPFRALGSEAVAALEARASPAALAPGQLLFADGARTDALYLLLGGRLEATEEGAEGEAEGVVRVLGPGEAVDELQLLAGSARPVRVRAAEACTLLRVPGDHVDALVARHPDLRQARRRLHRRQLLCRLHTLFGPFDAGLLDRVEALAEWVHLRRGELLFEQDDPADALYFIVSGRVRTVQFDREGVGRPLGTAGRGDSIGEMAFFTGGRRTARVEAVRDTVLVALTHGEFEALVAERPPLLRRVTGGLVGRIGRGAGAGPDGGVVNVAVMAATPGVDLPRFCARLADALRAFGPTLHLTPAEVERRMAEPGIAQAWDDAAERDRLLAWLEAQEAAHRFVLYQGEPGVTPWARRCLRQADRAVWVARADADPAPGDAERALADLEDASAAAPRILALLHPAPTRLPSGTRRWLEGRRVGEHLHLRGTDEPDLARLARVLAGRAVGLVLGGGGARGLAHIGVLRALAEAGVPIDRIGGTSMGASIAAQHALGWTPDEIVAMNRRVWVEIRPHRRYTLPLLSIIGHRKAEECGRMMYGDTEIEDLWVPFFCVSSNLTTAEMVVHRSGPLLRAATASASLPGAALPVLHDGHLLVDGALLNNVPADVMRGQGCGVVIASEVSVEEDAAFACDRIPSPREVLRARLTGRAPVRFPSLLEVVLRASMLHSVSRERENLARADLCLRPPIDGFSLMDFSPLDALVDVGYRHARDVLAEWPGARR